MKPLMSLKQFAELYLKAYYFRPDGANRDYTKYMDKGQGYATPQTILTALEAIPNLTILDFRITYDFKSFDKGQPVLTFYIKTPYIPPLKPNVNPHWDALMAALDLSDGECSPMYWKRIKGTYAYYRIRESY